VNKKILAMILTGMMMFSGSAVWAASDGNGDMDQDQTQTQLRDPDQTQDQIQDQTQDQSKDQDQTRLMLKDRLHINDEAKLQMQDRLKAQDQDRIHFPDIEQNWAKQQIMEAYNWGLVNGYPDGNFNPGRTVTGLEAVLMTSSLAKCISGLDTEAPVQGSINWDMVPEWARERLQEATAMRIAVQSQLYGEEQLNRLQFAVMLAKSLGLEPVALSEGEQAFADQNQISAENLGYVLALKNQGIIAGENGYFYPERIMTRAEIAAMLIRVLNNIE